MTERTCVNEGCNGVVYARGICSHHYGMAYRSADFIAVYDPTFHRLSEIDTEAKTATCSICGPVRIRVRSGGRSHQCRTAFNMYRSAHKHRLTRAERGRLLEAQGGVCAICQHSDPNLLVDHDHACCPGRESCGKCVRGLLCQRCNTGLGQFADDSRRLALAIDYLSAHG